MNSKFITNISFFFNVAATTKFYTLSLHDALPILLPFRRRRAGGRLPRHARGGDRAAEAGLESIRRSEEHTSELQSPDHLVCRLLLEKKKNFIVEVSLLIDS